MQIFATTYMLLLYFAWAIKQRGKCSRMAYAAYLMHALIWFVSIHLFSLMRSLLGSLGTFIDKDSTNKIDSNR